MSVIVVGVRASNLTTRLYDDAGSLMWSADHGADVYCVCVDADGNIYTGGVRTSGGITTRKYSINGTLLWSADHGGTVRAIAIDSNGNLYTAGTYNYGIIRKYNSSGTEIVSGWPWYNGDHVYGLCVDASNNLYVAGAQVYNQTYFYYFNVRKIDGSGNEQWYYNNGPYNAYGISVINSTQVKYVGAQNGQGTGHVLDQSNGASSSIFDHGATVYAVAANSNGDYGGARNGSGYTTRIGSANLDHGATVYAMAVDSSSGDVYTGGVSSSSVTARKYSSTGAEYTGGWPINTGSTVYGIAWTSQAPLFGILAPALGLAVSLAIPSLSTVIFPPALSWPFAIGVPDTTSPPWPPDGVPSIYRLIVTPSTQEYPLAALTCTRRRGESAWMVATVPIYSEQMIADLRAQLGLQGYLVVYAGSRNALGAEIIGEFLKAVFTEIHLIRTPYQASIELTGRIVNPPFTAQSRILRQVSVRGIEGGKRRVQCAVDPLLKPGDTVTDLDPFVVGAISYSVSPTSATMTVTEDG